MFRPDAGPKRRFRLRQGGGKILRRVSDRVTRVINRSYAVGMHTGRFSRCRPDSPAAAWYFFSFCPKMLHDVQLFWAKAWNLPLCRRRKAPFAGNRVTPVIHRSYAVGSNPGVCPDTWPGSPPAGWKIFFFCRNIWHNVQDVPAKDKNVPCCRRRSRRLGLTAGRNRLPPRTSCY